MSDGANIGFDAHDKTRQQNAQIELLHQSERRLDLCARNAFLGDHKSLGEYRGLTFLAVSLPKHCDALEKKVAFLAKHSDRADRALVPRKISARNPAVSSRVIARRCQEAVAAPVAAPASSRFHGALRWRRPCSHPPPLWRQPCACSSPSQSARRFSARRLRHRQSPRR
jgi:hypothetical protein